MIFCITDEIIIKINIYEKIYIFLLLLIVAINIGFSICGEMKFSDLELLKLEALANPEIDGRRRKRTITFVWMCNYSK